MRNILIFSRQPAERCKASPVPENCPRPQIKVICSQGEKQYFLQNERKQTSPFTAYIEHHLVDSFLFFPFRVFFTLLLKNITLVRTSKENSNLVQLGTRAKGAKSDLDEFAQFTSKVF